MDEKEERLDAERREKRDRRTFEKATKEQPWQNSLGMKFVPVAGTPVLFNIWDTRLEDFNAFVESVGYDATKGMYSIGKDGWKRRGATLEGMRIHRSATELLSTRAPSSVRMDTVMYWMKAVIARCCRSAM